MNKNPIADAIRDSLNESHPDHGRANVTNAMFAVARAIDRLTFHALRQPLAQQHKP
jgi:hypothetical protein